MEHHFFEAARAVVKNYFVIFEVIIFLGGSSKHWRVPKIKPLHQIKIVLSTGTCFIIAQLNI